MLNDGTALAARPFDLELDLGSTMAPVPWFIRVAILIAAWERKDETISPCVLREPSKRLGSLKLGLKRRTTRCGHVYGSARVVFAVTGRRTYRKYPVKRQTVLQFSTNDLGLPLNVSKCGNDLQCHTIRTRGLRHSTPCLCCRRNKQVLLSVSVGLGNDQFVRLATDLERPLRNKRGGDRKLFQRCRDSCGVIVQQKRCHSRGLTFAATGARPPTHARHGARAPVRVGCAVMPQMQDDLPSPGKPAPPGDT